MVGVQHPCTIAMVGEKNLEVVCYLLGEPSTGSFKQVIKRNGSTKSSGFYSKTETCVRQNNSTPKDVHVLIPESVTLLPYMAKGDFANVIRPRILT